jgi:hypothetical protein
MSVVLKGSQYSNWRVSLFIGAAIILFCFRKNQAKPAFLFLYSLMKKQSGGNELIACHMVREAMRPPRPFVSR